MTKNILLFVLLMATLVISQVDLTLIRLETDITPPPPPSGTCEDTIAGVWPMSNYPDDPAYTISPPKAFMYVAQNTGNINCVRVKINGLSGDRTSDDTIIAVYETRIIGGQAWPGRMKVYQMVQDYNWTSVGIGYHVFDDLQERFSGARATTTGDSVYILVWSAPGAGEVIGVCRSDDEYFATPRVAINNGSTPATVAGVDSAQYDLFFGAAASGYGYFLMGEIP